MDIQDALKFVDELVLNKKGIRLNDLQRDVFQGAWEGLNYKEIHSQFALKCELDHLERNIAYELWKLLSDILGEKVSKKTLKGPVEAACRKKQQEASDNPGQDERDIPFSNVRNRGDSQPPLAEPLNFAFYVERVPYEAQCYKAILQPGEFLRIKAPQRMGKTWLTQKLLNNLIAEGFQTVSLSFKLADSGIHFTNLDKFLRWFCTNVTRQLELPSQLDDYWDQEDLGSKMSCTAYFQEYLLQHADTPLVLCLDDLDLIFPHEEISAEFFKMLRSWYEQGKSSRRNIFTRLRVVLIHSTQNYIRLNIKESPFNVGICIELSDFSQQQVQNLAKQRGLDWDAAQVEQLMKMVGGYPYLVQQALSHLKDNQDITLDEFLGTASKESGIYGNYLRSLLLDLQQNSQLASALKKVVTTTESVQLEPQEAYELHSMGLVEWQGNEVKPRCNLFRQYFCTRLGES